MSDKDQVFRPARRTDFFSEPSLQVVLIEPQIPPNTGTIGRLCYATGSRFHLVEPLGFDIDEKSVRRAGLDYWEHLDLQVHSGWEAVFGPVLPPERCFFLSVRSPKPYWEIPIQPGDALVFGQETTGLPKEIFERYPDQIYHIPILPETVRSINLANAVSIVLYDSYRRLKGIP